MCWMGPMRRAGLFVLPAIAGLAAGAGALWLAGSRLAETAQEENGEKTVRAYVDGKPVRSWVMTDRDDER